MCTVKTAEEVMEFSYAFYQYYRESANYLERTSTWVERVGIANIQAVLENSETRKELNRRLDEALSIVEDPWKKIVEDEKTRKFLELILN